MLDGPMLSSTITKTNYYVAGRFWHKSAIKEHYTSLDHPDESEKANL